MSNTIGKNISDVMLHACVLGSLFRPIDRLVFLINEEGERTGWKHIKETSFDEIRRFIDGINIPSYWFILTMAKVLNVDWKIFFDGVNTEYAGTTESAAYNGCLKITKEQQEQDKMSEKKSGYRTIHQNIQQAIDSHSTVYPKVFYLNIYKMTGWKHDTEDMFIENDGCRLWIDCGGRESEIAKILNAASKILDVNVMNFFRNVEMHLNRVYLAEKCLDLQLGEKLKKETEEKQNGSKEKELMERAAEFERRCATWDTMIVDEDNGKLIPGYSEDLSYLKYVDCFKALKNVIDIKSHYVFKELIKLEEFRSILTHNNGEIIKHVIKAVIDKPDRDDRLKMFCMMVADKDVRENLWDSSALMDFFTKLSENKEIFEHKNVRNMMFVLDCYINAGREDGYIDDFQLNYKNAIIEEIMGE